MGKMVFSVYAAGEGPREAYATLDLPATPYEIEDALEKVRIQTDEKLFLDIEEFYDFRFLAPYLEDVNDLYGLNTLAEKLARLVDYESAVFAGQLKMDLDARISDITLPRLLSLADNTPYCDVIDVALNDSQLGKFYAENGFVTELEQLPDEAFKIIEDMLDYEQKQLFIRLEPNLIQCIFDLVRCCGEIQCCVSLPWAFACCVDGEYHLTQRPSRLSADRVPPDN